MNYKLKPDAKEQHYDDIYRYYGVTGGYKLPTVEYTFESAFNELVRRIKLTKRGNNQTVTLRAYRYYDSATESEILYQIIIP